MTTSEGQSSDDEIKKGRVYSSELMFRRFFEKIPGLYLVLEPRNFKIVAASDAYLESTMTERPEIVGEPFFEVFPGSPGTDGMQQLWDSLKTVKTSRETDTMPVMHYPIPRPKTEDFEDRWWSPINSPVFNEEGNLTYIIHRVEDVTPVIKQLKKEDKVSLLQQFEEADFQLSSDILLRAQDLQQAKEQAVEKLEKINETLEDRVKKRTRDLQSYQQHLRSLASELNKAGEQERHRLATELHSNLGQILAAIKMKVDGLKDAEDPTLTIDKITEVSGMLDDALSYTRNLMMELKPPPVLDEDGVKELLYWVVDSFKKYDLKVNLEDDKRSKPVTKEVRTTLYQCVRELLYNVIEYAGVDEARLALDRVGDKVRITVEDGGKGFDMEETEPVPTEEGGFGLFNIRERMDWIGGRMVIASEPGKGTKVALYAPLKKEEKPGASCETAKKSEYQKRYKLPELQIMLADDHQLVRNGFRQMLNKQQDLTVIAEASDGEEAVEMARKTNPDVILMDVNMPRMDGIDATKIISSELSQICIIGLSLHDSDEVIQNMLSAGAAAYVTKDQAFETLCETIRSQFEREKQYS